MRDQPGHISPLITDAISASPVRILVFSQISKQRDAKLVLERLAAALSPIHIDHVIFTLYDPQQDLDSPAGKFLFVLIKLAR